MIVERQTPNYEVMSVNAGSTIQIDIQNCESVTVLIRHSGGGAGNFSAFALTPGGSVLWILANAVALAVGGNSGFQLSSAAGYGVAAPDAAAGAYSTFLGLPPAIQINMVTSNALINVIRRER